MAETKILVVEDEVIVAKNIENRLLQAGYSISGMASTGKEAIKKAVEQKPDLILMDINLKGDMDGIEAAKSIRKKLRLPIIFLTSYTDEDTFKRAVSTEPFGYLIKPFEIKELNRTVEIALYKNKINNRMYESQHRYEIAVEAGKTGVWEFWPKENKYFSDNNLKFLYGFNEDELSDNLEDWSALVYEDDRAEMSDKFDNFLSGRAKEFRYEHRIYKKDGSVGWVIDHGLLFEADDEKPLRLIGTTTDITERKLSEIALRRSEERFRSIFENAGIGMATLSENGEFTKVNESFCEMMGYKESELLEMNFRDVTHPADMEATLKLKDTLVKDNSEKSKHMEKRYLTKNGETVWALTTVSLLEDFEHKPGYFIAQVQNITKRKLAQEKLEQYAEELKTLNSSKDKFFSIISHDLRNPFNSLLGITEYISEYFDDLSEKDLRNSIENVFSSSQKLYNLILNLLEWSRIQSGRLVVEKTKIDLNESIAEIINLYSELAESKKIKLKTDNKESITIKADKYMIDTVLRNLVSNAIKYTNRNGIVLIFAEKEADHAKVIVHDDGIGVPLKHQQNLFSIDEQFKREGTASEKGTGLGLILCKEFVEKNGGTIALESDEGKGSKFWFTVPLSME